LSTITASCLDKCSDFSRKAVIASDSEAISVEIQEIAAPLRGSQWPELLSEDQFYIQMYSESRTNLPLIQELYLCHLPKSIAGRRSQQVYPGQAVILHPFRCVAVVDGPAPV
jgi:hypothetical protein